MYYCKYLTILLTFLLSLATAQADQTCTASTYGYDDPEIQSELQQFNCLYFQTYQPDGPNDITFIVSRAGYFTPVIARGTDHMQVNLTPGNYMAFAYHPNLWGYSPFEVSGWWAYMNIVLGPGPKYIQGLVRDVGRLIATKMVFVEECHNL